MGDCYVCSGAEMKCNFGSDTAELVVLPSSHNTKLAGEPVAVMTDNVPMVNILAFGKCSNLSNPQVAAATSANYGRLQEMPCVPVISAPWFDVKMDVRAGGTPVLIKSSKIMCNYGGMIEIKDPGQDIVKEQ